MDGCLFTNPTVDPGSRSGDRVRIREIRLPKDAHYAEKLFNTLGNCAESKTFCRRGQPSLDPNGVNGCRLDFCYASLGCRSPLLTTMPHTSAPRVRAIAATVTQTRKDRRRDGEAPYHTAFRSPRSEPHGKPQAGHDKRSQALGGSSPPRQRAAVRRVGARHYKVVARSASPVSYRVRGASRICRCYHSPGSAHHHSPAS